MSDVQYQLTQQNNKFNTTFRIKQFNVKAVNQFPIYVKMGGGLASITNYDYIVQPNSDYSSAQIDETGISLFTPATNFLNPAILNLYDSVRVPAGNTPYVSAQVVGNNAAYPFSSITTGGLVGSAVLPDITFDNLNPLYFLYSGVQPCIMTYTPTAGGGGAFSAANFKTGDGLMIFVPNRLRVAERFTINTPVPNVPFTIDTFYYNGNIGKNPSPKFGEFIAPSLATTTDVFSYIVPPAFYYELILINSSSPLATYTGTIQISTEDINRNDVNFVVNQSFSASLAAQVGFKFGTQRLIEPTLALCPEYRWLHLAITTTAGSGALPIVQFNVWDYTS